LYLLCIPFHEPDIPSPFQIFVQAIMLIMLIRLQGKDSDEGTSNTGKSDANANVVGRTSFG